MLRHALRRLLWTLPTLVGVSVAAFLFLSLVPDPTDDPRLPVNVSTAERARMRRERFVDLPRLVNTSPDDVRKRALRAVRAVADDGPDAPAGRAELVRLGGAALPHVLPALDTLSPEPRTRVALALAPIAERMGLPNLDEAYGEARAVAFWTRFWTDRGIEFRDVSVKSAVARLARRGSASRATELRELDTFALDPVLSALERPTDDASIARAAALVDIAAHVTDKDDRIRPGDDLGRARACVERWQKFWSVYRNDYVPLSGPALLAAMLTETRYGKWALGALTQRLGTRSDGTFVLDEIAARAPVTLTILFGAIALAYAVAVPLGVLSASRRGRRTDFVLACVVLGLHCIPTAALAVLLGRGLSGGLALAVSILVLAMALVAAPTRQGRSAIATVLSSEHVRTARARGAGRARSLFVHALPSALVPLVTMAAREAPMALGGAFAIEHVLGLRGLGEATLVAVRDGDASWLMAMALFAAGFAALGMIATDLAHAVVDPRVVPALAARKGPT